MIKYHGTPITPVDVFLKSVTNKNVLVSWANPQDINNAFANCNKVILDNGAFTFWKKKKGINWDDYYIWVEKHNNREMFFIPDIIDGSEKENDDLLKTNHFKDGVPVWHIAESFDRLERLSSDYKYLAFGSSGEYSELGTEKWHKRMNDAMKIVCDKDGKPQVKIHMLRCLNPKIFTKYPFYSGDSTNLARNHNLGNGLSQWKSILERIEKYNSPEYYTFKKYYETNNLFKELA